jgi:hypothetical protein
MKKLLALLLVLVVTSAASATLQISVNGEKEPVESQITIGPSDHITLDIWTDADIQPFEAIPWMLVCEVVGGDITGGTSVHAAMTISGLTKDFEKIIPPEGQEGIWGLAANTTVIPVEAGTTLADLIDFHCLGCPPGGPVPCDIVISLYDAPDGAPPTTLFDSVVIHQTPEPASMLLLGLGGLLLRRRK